MGSLGTIRRGERMGGLGKRNKLSNNLLMSAALHTARKTSLYTGDVWGPFSILFLRQRGLIYSASRSGAGRISVFRALFTVVSAGIVELNHTKQF